MIQKTDPILIIGAGSIGERHIGNLQLLGYQNIVVLRSRNLPFRKIRQDSVRVITSWGDVGAISPKAAFICTPTSMHLEQAIQCAEMGCHVFVEKPLSHTLEYSESLKEAVILNKVYCFVGYMMRYHPLVQAMKEAVNDQKYGPLLSFTSHWGEYLPDWHPWEDYRTGYAARKDQGGGAALTLSHDLDLIYFITGSSLHRHFMIANRKSSLEVTAEAGADFIMEFKNGVTGHVHLNYYEQPSNRYTELVFENASLRFDYYRNTLTVRRKGEDPTMASGEVMKLEDFDRNQLFIAQLEDFFARITRFTQLDSIRNIEQAFQIVEMCLSDRNERDIYLKVNN